MSAPPTNKLRTYVLTASVAAITATGAWYGAGLKTRQEFKQERNAILETDPAERIEQMHIMRSRMLQSRQDLQAKIERLEARVAAQGSAAEKADSG